MAEPKEPQSYGSEGSWVTGDVGQEVNRQKGHPNSQHGDFHTSHAGGEVSPEQLAENAQPAGPATDERTPTQKVTDKPGGAKSDSFFKKRDYGE